MGERSTEEALREVCRRYLHTYGPARPKDFREWFGVATVQAGRRASAVRLDRNELEEVDVEGHPAFVLAGDTDFPRAGTSVRLLPEYDVYVMGFRERDQLVPDAARRQVAAHGRGKYEGPAGVRFLMIDGDRRRALGTQEEGASASSCAVTPSRKLTRAERTGLGRRGRAHRRLPRARARAYGRMTTGVPSGTVRIR